MTAQFNETIRSGRPGQSIGGYTVGKNILQFQQGVEYDGQINNENKPTAFITDHVIRFGVMERVELSTLFDYHKDTFTIKDSIFSYHGINNFHIGFRVNISEQQGILPTTAFQMRLKMPGVSNNFGANNLAPVMTFVANWNLSKKLTLGTNWIYTTNGNDPIVTGKYVINLGFPISNKLSGFIENYGQLRKDVFETRFDAGFAYIATKNIQLDASAGYGKNNELQDYFVSLGISWRVNFNKSIKQNQ
ncbi:MAG: transporter [Bacteroidia bacterium]